MPRAHDRLLSAATEAADKLHADTSVDKETTLESLKDLRDHVETLIDAVSEDIDAEDDGDHDPEGDG
jgi:hypothetical protein